MRNPNDEGSNPDEGAGRERKRQEGLVVLGMKSIFAVPVPIAGYELSIFRLHVK
jgi:hypothetical protein